VNSSHHHYKERYAFFAWAFLLIASIMAGLAVVEWTENKRHMENQRRLIVEKLSTIRARLEGDLNAELLLSRSIITEVATNTDITQERFFLIAEHFFKASKHIRNIGLAKGTILTYVYPVEGNEKAIGLNYKTIPTQWPAVRKVIEGRKTVVAGPLTLVQGGTAIIGRSPIYIQNPVSGGETYFGILSVVINVPSLFASAGLSDEDSLLQIAMRGKDALGADGDVFYGDGDLFTIDPVLMKVSLPGGYWLMAAIPANGWSMASPRIAAYRIVAILVGLVVLFLLLVQQREITIRKKVEEERETVIKSLREALAEVKQLSGLLPICTSCKKIRDDKGYWNQIESYISEHSEAQFSHSICRDCARKYYPELDIYGEE
jgi:sensor domain CHASE-containing protein